MCFLVNTIEMGWMFFLVQAAMLVDTGVYLGCIMVYPFSIYQFTRFAEPILFETDSSITEETQIALLGGLN